LSPPGDAKCRPDLCAYRRRQLGLSGAQSRLEQRADGESGRRLRKHGRKTGFASSLEFRTFVASHTDTFAIGPVSAADLVAMAK